MIRVISLISLEPLSVVGVWGYICHKGKLAAFLLANKFPHSIFAFIHSHLSLVILSTLSSLILSYSLFPLSCFPSTSSAYAFFTHSLMLSSSLSPLFLYICLYSLFCLFPSVFIYSFPYPLPILFSFLFDSPHNLFTHFQQYTSLFTSYSLSLSRFYLFTSEMVFSWFCLKLSLNLSS